MLVLAVPAITAKAVITALLTRINVFQPVSMDNMVVPALIAILRVNHAGEILKTTAIHAQLALHLTIIKHAVVFVVMVGNRTQKSVKMGI
jgi:hypothetical protein